MLSTFCYCLRGVWYPGIAREHYWWYARHEKSTFGKLWNRSAFNSIFGHLMTSTDTELQGRPVGAVQLDFLQDRDVMLGSRRSNEYYAIL